MQRSGVMHLSKLGYYSDFVLYPICAALLTVYALGTAASGAMLRHTLIFAAAALIGVALWTLMEYLFHRFIFHEWPVFREMHDVHHADPKAAVGTPSWVSTGLFLAAVLVPIWLVAGDDAACGATVGLMAGYYWYIVVHHGTHRWSAKPGTYFYNVWRHHARHHYDPRPGNFGVTSAFWDRVFGTALKRRAGADGE